MKKEIVINATANDIRVAILEDDRLAEVFLEVADKESRIGSIYLGKVQRIVQGMNAAFVDIGEQQHAFLHFSDVGNAVDEDESDDGDDEGDDDGDETPQGPRPKEPAARRGPSSGRGHKAKPAPADDAEALVQTTTNGTDEPTREPDRRQRPARERPGRGDRRGPKAPVRAEEPETAETPEAPPSDVGDRRQEPKRERDRDRDRGRRKHDRRDREEPAAPEALQTTLDLGEPPAEVSVRDVVDSFEELPFDVEHVEEGPQEESAAEASRRKRRRRRGRRGRGRHGERDESQVSEAGDREDRAQAEPPHEHEVARTESADDSAAPPRREGEENLTEAQQQERRSRRGRRGGRRGRGRHRSDEGADRPIDADESRASEASAGEGTGASGQRQRPRDERPRDERPRDERPRDERPRDERPRDERPRDGHRHADRRHDDRRHDDRRRDEHPHREHPRDERPRDERPRDDRHRDERPRDERHRDERPADDGPRVERHRDERPSDERPEEKRTPDDRRRDESGRRGGRRRDDRRRRDVHGAEGSATDGVPSVVPEPSTVHEAPAADERKPRGKARPKRGRPASASSSGSSDATAEPAVIQIARIDEPKKSGPSESHEDKPKPRARKPRGASKKPPEDTGGTAGKGGAPEMPERVDAPKPKRRPSPNRKGGKRPPGKGSDTMDAKLPTFQTKRSGEVTIALERSQDIIVQVTRESYSQKGVRVSTKVSLPGRFLVLLPLDASIGVSRKVQSTKERRRLRRVARSILPEGYGCIIRTNAQNKDADLIRQDLVKLIDTWRGIEEKLKASKGPGLLYRDQSVANTVMRDLFTPDINRVVIDSRTLYRQIRDYVEWAAPGLAEKIELYTGEAPIFDHYHVEQELEKMFQRRLYLPSGGYVILDQTEAMMVIDVNSGRFADKSEQEITSLRTNIEAAREIARQIRLRDIGGLLVIDFIDLYHESNRKKVYDEMKKEMRRDRAKSVVLPMTQFGLVQMTRQRVRQQVLATMSEPCPTCDGSGMIPSKSTVLRQIERWLQRFRANSREFRLMLRANPAIIDFLTQPGDDGVSRLARLMMRNFVRLKVVPDDTLAVTDYHFFSVRHQADITEKFRTEKSAA